MCVEPGASSSTYSLKLHPKHYTVCHKEARHLCFKAVPQLDVYFNLKYLFNLHDIRDFLTVDSGGKKPQKNAALISSTKDKFS